jgi:hypothetical protein
MTLPSALGEEKFGYCKLRPLYLWSILQPCQYSGIKGPDMEVLFPSQIVYIRSERTFSAEVVSPESMNEKVDATRRTAQSYLATETSVSRPRIPCASTHDFPDPRYGQLFFFRGIVHHERMTRQTMDCATLKFWVISQEIVGRHPDV